MPGVTERYVMEVDEEICGDGAVISMATMIGKSTQLRLNADKRSNALLGYGAGHLRNIKADPRLGFVLEECCFLH